METICLKKLVDNLETGMEVIVRINLMIDFDIMLSLNNIYTQKINL